MGINNMNSEISATSNSPVEFDNLRENNLVMSEEQTESEENLFRSNRNEWGLTSNNFSEGGADSESEKKDTEKSEETPKSDTPKSDTPKSDTPKEGSAFSEGGGDLLDLKRFSDIRETTISDHYTEGNAQNHEKFLNLLDNISEQEINSEMYMDGGARKKKKGKRVQKKEAEESSEEESLESQKKNVQ